MSPHNIALFLTHSSAPLSLHRHAPRRCVRRTIVATAEKPVPTSTPSFNIPAFADFLYNAQSNLCSKLQDLDNRAKFSSDQWQLQNGNSGITRVLQNGRLFEKAGVNVSVVGGILSETRAKAMRSTGRICEAGMEYRAAALSYVCHAQSPFVPTFRGDVRVFATGDQYWAGGGVDLTVFYVNEAQISAFHKRMKRPCGNGCKRLIDPLVMPMAPLISFSDVILCLRQNFKKQCDQYFYLPSRAEHRGVGGLFYDGVTMPESRLLEFQARVLSESLQAYLPILEENAPIPWTKIQKRWQRIRRGRYIEFNLLNDRGVQFGLAGGDPSRTEAIMISAPPSIEWPYKFIPEPGSPEEKTLKLLSGVPVEWAEL